MSQAITVILQGKKKIDISDQLLLMKTENQLNAIPTAVIQLASGNFADRDFRFFEYPDFQIGSELNILAGYEGPNNNENNLFQGIVVQLDFLMLEGSPVLQLTLKDPAFRLVQAFDTEVFNKATDKEMIERVISKIQGVSLKKASSSLSAVIYDQFVRKEVSAWDFICERASQFGLIVQLQNGALSILDPTATTGSRALELGIDPIIDLHLIQDAQNLNKNVQINYWNINANKLEGVKSTSSSLAKAVSAPDANFNQLDLTNKKSAEGLLQYLTNEEASSVLRGELMIAGSPEYAPMQMLTLNHFPSPYKGSHVISGVIHELSNGTWTTDVEIGQTPLTSQMESHGGAAIYSTIETEIATVMKFEKDPENLGRIPVKVLAFGNAKYWAYPAQVSAGNKQSSFILPEENEQVMIGFLHGSYEQGFIVTSTYLGRNKPPSPFKLDAKTPIGFMTKTGLKQIFNDDNVSVELSSSSSNKMLLEKSSGISLQSNKSLKTQSSSNTELKASGKMTLKGTIIDLN